ncbi:MAG: hypothetical protein PWR10_721 [Halanaerobiales bacterium]|nr:hypothetical protein [Halanaerobiales bacterium]
MHIKGTFCAILNPAIYINLATSTSILVENPFFKKNAQKVKDQISGVLNLIKNRGGIN